MEKTLEEYGAYLKTLGMSENTRLSYIRDLRAFCDFAEANGVEDIFSATQKTLQDYADGLKEAGRANSTAARQIAALRKFYSYAFQTGRCSINPAINIKLPHIEKKLPEAITPREVVKLLNQPKCTDLKGYRDKAMLELVYATGIKVSELINLTVHDVDIKREMLSCSSSGRRRFIPIGKAAAEALDNYIKKARALMVSDGHMKTLFVNCSGTPLTRQGFWKILRRYADMAGIKADINAQTIRNSFAVHLLQNGADINAVSEMLGHMDVVTTRVYNQVLKNNIKKIYKKAHPRA